RPGGPGGPTGARARRLLGGPDRGDARAGVDHRLAADLQGAEVDVGRAAAAVDPGGVHPAAVHGELQLGLPALAGQHGVDAEVVVLLEALAHVEVVVQVGVPVVPAGLGLAAVVLPRDGDAAVAPDGDDRVLRVVVALDVAPIDAELLLA